MTALIAVKTRTDVYLGADSKEVWQNTERRACKIFRFGDFFFSIAGLSWYDGTGYSVAEVGERAFSGDFETEIRVNNFAELLRSELERALRHIRSNKLAEYEEKVEGKEYAHPLPDMDGR
jgi:hypothetical protein